MVGPASPSDARDRRASVPPAQRAPNPRRRHRSKPLPIADLVVRLVEQSATTAAPGRGPREMLLVFRAFAELGPPFSEHMEPTELRRDTLGLVVDDPALLTEMSFLRETFLAELNRRIAFFGGRTVVKDVRLRLGRIARRVVGVAPPPVLSPVLEAELAEWLAPIRDPEVRASVERAARQSLAARRTSP